MKKKFDEQTEMQIVQDRLSGATIKEIETKYGCNKKYVQRLMKRHSQQGDIQKRDNPQGDIQEGDIRKGDVNAENIDSKSNEALDEGDIKGDNQVDIHVGDNRTSDIKKLDVGRLEDKKEMSNLSDIKGTEADARAHGTTTKIATDDRETIKNTDESTTPDDKQAAEQRPVIIVQAAKDLRCYSSYKDKCRIAKEAINQILNELEFTQWTIDNINSLFDNATRSQRPQLEISQEDTKEFFGFDGTYTELQEYLRNKIKDGWLAEVS